MRQPRQLPESLPAGDVDAFVASLRTHRDRAMALAMLLGGLRSAEVRGLMLSDADMGRRRLPVIGKGGKERHVPVDQAFFAELAAYLRLNARPAWPHRSVSSCCAARPPGSPSRRRDCAACSAATGRRPGLSGSGRTACGTPTGPNSNAGMSLQALMALLGHVTPQMTIRYATLASPTLRAAYDEAMGKMRRQFTLTPAGKPIIPDKVSWLNSEMLKTRVAHGYCSRHEAAAPARMPTSARPATTSSPDPNSTRTPRPAHRRPAPPRRRAISRLGQRSRPARPRRRRTHRPP